LRLARSLIGIFFTGASTTTTSHRPRAVSPISFARAGRPYVDYWIGRLEFGIGYLDTIEELHQAARAEADKKPAETRRRAESALATFRAALEAYARVARDQSDRGTLATLAEFAYRPLKAKVASLMEARKKG
jgi:hypothetical protein